MSKSGEGEKQGQHCGSRQPCDKDRAAQGSAENDLAASGLLGRIRRCLAFVPFCHRWIGSVSMHPVGSRYGHAALALCGAKSKQGETFLAGRLKCREPADVPLDAARDCAGRLDERPWIM
ncbi:hypothetical protein IVA80_23275 [Bradyrhizobium sp. 139]|uniref:hypothetical protein n=1 Tax=Bradyrhizobium sp. 139 TaxID=2782616 RepID=UPI001FFBA191|nr:hypothetical protein [Bradyrhizobium sp. 139]MCK1743689.1 hypothetical protein [Bradyrhizobium sp. 139]